MITPNECFGEAAILPKRFHYAAINTANSIRMQFVLKRRAHRPLGCDDWQQSAKQQSAVQAGNGFAIRLLRDKNAVWCLEVKNDEIMPNTCLCFMDEQMTLRWLNYWAPICKVLINAFSSDTCLIYRLIFPPVMHNRHSLHINHRPYLNSATINTFYSLTVYYVWPDWLFFFFFQPYFKWHVRNKQQNNTCIKNILYYVLQYVHACVVCRQLQRRLEPFLFETHNRKDVGHGVTSEPVCYNSAVVKIRVLFHYEGLSGLAQEYAVRPLTTHR